MSNFQVEPDKIDYSEGQLLMDNLYNERTTISHTWEDFLNLPKVNGYVNNAKRVPNDFRVGVTDKKDDEYRTLKDALEMKSD